MNISHPVRVLIAAAVAAVALLAGGRPVAAHEFGSFAIDRYAAILVSPDGVELDYVIGFAETPTQADGDRVEADPAAFCQEMIASVEFTIDGAPVDLGETTATTLRQDGDGGLTVLRTECNWTAALDLSEGSHAVVFDDDNYRERVGWREVVVVGDRMEISGDVSSETATGRLTDFPDPEDNPDTSTARFTAAASADAEPGELDSSVPGDDDGGGDAFSDLIADADGGIWAMTLSLGFAGFLGALHSLAPGHGKTVIGAYLVGTRGTKFQAFILAVAVALSHTLGVLILGIITYAAGAAFAPERVYPWLQGLSALIVLGIGIWLVVTAWRDYQARIAGRAAPEHRHLHDHGVHDHAHGTAALEELHGLPEHALGRAAVATVATGSAVVVEPDLLPHHHDHGDHGHDHGDGWHRHGIFPHTHKFDLDELDLQGKVSWKTLAMLGLSGGLVPSTSAIIVLLGAIQLNRLAFGGLLILSFGIGMAIALISVGLGMVALRDKAFGAMDGNQIIATARRVIVPLAATAVLCIGVFLVIRAWVEIADL